jgi:hypothetical protein
MNSDNFIDLTAKNYPSLGDFSDDEDEIAFGANPNLYRRKIWKLRHNDPNYCLVKFDRNELLSNVNICSRVGVYIWSSKHVKNPLLDHCSLTDINMEQLFGKIVQQNETNEYLVKENILINLGVPETTLVGSIIESVTSFQNLVNLDISHNVFGMNGLNILVKVLAGCPIESLDLKRCNIDSISPLKGLQKCSILNTLILSGNTVNPADVDTITFLLGNGYPKLRTLELQSCGIDDDIIDIIGPTLAKNKTVRYLILHNIRNGAENRFGTRGLSVLCRVVHDSSSFRSTLQSNHFIWKIPIPNPTDVLFHACFPNLAGGYIDSSTIALRKYLVHLSSRESFDMSPFMELDIKLVPLILARMYRAIKYSDITLNVFYKIWSCKMFQERVEMASQISDLKTSNSHLIVSQQTDKKTIGQLQDENAQLKQQLATLMFNNTQPMPDDEKSGTNTTESIATRVKTKRANQRNGEGCILLELIPLNNLIWWSAVLDALYLLSSIECFSFLPILP